MILSAGWMRIVAHESRHVAACLALGAHVTRVVVDDREGGGGYTSYRARRLDVQTIALVPFLADPNVAWRLVRSDIEHAMSFGDCDRAAARARELIAAPRFAGLVDAIERALMVTGSLEGRDLAGLVA